MHAPETRSGVDGLGAPDRSAPLVSGKDLAVLAKLPLSAGIAWAVPERFWAGLALRAAQLERRTLARTAQRIAGMIDPARLTAPVETIAQRQLAMIRLDQLCFLRSYRPGGWQAELALEGREHLDAALARGRGAILWVAPTIFQWLPTKRTLFEAGYRLHHLSSPQHGFSSPSRFGRACLNPIRTTIENRYLAERVLLGTGGQAHAALRRLAALLRQNEVVSITVGSAGARAIHAPLLDGSLWAASGAPHLATRTGAALLPVVTVRTASGQFRTWIGPPLATPDPGGHDGPPDGAVAAFARWFEPFALNHAEQVVWGLSCFRPSPGNSERRAERSSRE